MKNKTEAILPEEKRLFREHKNRDESEKQLNNIFFSCLSYELVKYIKKIVSSGHGRNTLSSKEQKRFIWHFESVKRWKWKVNFKIWFGLISLVKKKKSSRVLFTWHCKLNFPPVRRQNDSTCLIHTVTHNPG